MTLLYLYVEKYRILNQVEFNFTDKYNFHFDAKAREMSYKRNANALPDVFFCYDKKNAVVNCVSALIGNNGSGKTTVSEMLANLTSNINHTEHIIVFTCREHGNDKLYYYSNLSDLTEEKRKHLNDNLAPFKLYSPNRLNPKLDSLAFVYITNNYVPYSRILSMDNTINLSTSYLMKRDFEKRKNPTVGESRDEVDSRYHDQMELIRMVEIFASTDKLQNQQKSDSAKGMTPQFSLPRPIGLTVKIYNFDSRVEGPLKELSKGSRWLESVKCLITHETNLRTNTTRPEHYLFLSFLLNYIRHEISESSMPMRATAIINFVKQTSKLRHTCSNQTDCDDLVMQLFKLLKKSNHAITVNLGKVKATLDPDNVIDKFETLYKWLSSQNFPPTRNLAIHEPTIEFSFSMQKDVQLCIEFLQLYFKTVKFVHYLNFEFTPGLSAGEMSQFSLYSRLYKEFKDRDRFNNHCHTGDIILFFDEIEITIHPELQRNLLSNVILFLENYFPYQSYEYRFHLVFATHSPILLSDIPPMNVCYMKRIENSAKSINTSIVQSVFGANIHTLYRKSFLFDGCIMGAFAEMKINQLFERIDLIKESHSSLETIQCIEHEADIIGEPFVRQRVLDRLYEKVPKHLKLKRLAAQKKQIDAQINALKN